MLINQKRRYAEILRAKSAVSDFTRKVLCMNVHADDGEDVPTAPASGNVQPATSSSSGIELEKIIAQVRREEKDKLYGEIGKLKEQVKSLRESSNGYLMQIASLTEQLDAANSKAADTNVDALNGKIKELEQQLEEQKKNTPDAAAIRKEIEAEYEVKMYAKEQLDANKDKILSSFASDVTGKTKEEVDAAIKTAVEKSTAIKKELGLIDENGEPVKKQTETKETKSSTTPSGAKKKVATPSPAPAKPEETSFDPEYIRGLDVNSDEYKEFRKRMGLK